MTESEHVAQFVRQNGTRIDVRPSRTFAAPISIRNATRVIPNHARVQAQCHVVEGGWYTGKVHILLG